MFNIIPEGAKPLVRALDRHWYSRKECLILKPLTIHITNGNAETAESIIDHSSNLTLGWYAVSVKFGIFPSYKCVYAFNI